MAEKKLKINQSAVEINEGDYVKILSEIQTHIKKAQSEIVETVTREKVVMAWQIGKVIEQHLSKNTRAEYGERLIAKLEQDILVSKTVLYKMRSFYKSYPKLPKDDSRLNWSHYRVLAGIKKSGERKYLEELTKQNSWDSDELQQEATKLKNVESNIAKIRAKKAAKPLATNLKRLSPLRGKLFSYSLVKLEISDETFIDCGFKIFHKLEESLPAKDAQIVDVAKKNENYSLKKSQLTPRKINIYKAHLTRVVDGDTLHVVLDLGFKIFHEEILRLRGINAAEMASAEGKKSAQALTKILQGLPFLIIKTSKVDIYGRYVCDVFLPPKGEAEIDPQEVADVGVYLNQLLLDEGLAVRMEE